jgi:hypothetical protein
MSHGEAATPTQPFGRSVRQMAGAILKGSRPDSLRLGVPDVALLEPR